MEPNAPTPRSTTNVAKSAAFILLIAGFVAVVGLVSWKANEKDRVRAKTEAAARGMPTSRVVQISVEGMTCSGCANSVEAEITKVPGVASCDVDLEKKIATVRLINEVESSQLVAAVQTAGYVGTLEP